MFHRDGGISGCSVETQLLTFLTVTFVFTSASAVLSLSSHPGEDSDSDSDLSMEEERSLSIPSSESEDNVRLRGRIQRRFKRSNHSERLLTEPARNGTKGKGTLSPFKTANSGDGARICTNTH